MGRQGFYLPLPMHHQQSAAIAFCRCLAVMAGPAQALQVTFCIGSPMCFGCDVVNCLCFSCPAFTQTLLAQMLIPDQNHQPQPVPFGAIATFLSALTLLVVLPACIPVLFAVSAAVGGRLCAAAFAAYSGYA